jgi:hypothetical protein
LGLGVTAVDNYDGDITNNLLVVGHDLIDYSSYGTYEVSYIIMDSTGNSTFVTSIVTIKDTVDPIIDGVQHITKSVNDLLTAAEIIGKLNAEDNIDGDLISTMVIVQDSYTGYGDIPGEYIITFSVVDSAGNVFEYDVVIEVFNNIPDILYFDYTVLQLNRDEVLTLSNLELLLTSVGELDVYSNYSLQDDYTANQTLSGEYDYFVKFISNSGEVVIKNFTIIVDYSTELPIFIGEDEPNEVIEHVVNNWKYYVSAVIVGSAAVYLLKKKF